MTGLTQKRLREQLDYDPDTGVFLRKRARKTSLVGAEAGTVTELRGRTAYRRINVDGRLYYAHRLAWLYVHGEWPRVIDHANRNGLDNRISNLRSCTQVLNAGNASLRVDNLSGVKGVSWCRETSRWRAQLRVDKKSVNIGRFDTKEEAAAAYCEAAVRYFGEFANAR